MFRKRRVKLSSREALRLCPVVPIVGRILTRDMRLGGWDLPKGTAVVCSMYLAHRRAEAFPDPTRFNPARYLEKKAAPYELYPFGGGIRRCIGMAFAMFEMKMVLAQVLRRTRMVLDSKEPIRPMRRAITLVPSGGPRVRVLEKLPRGPLIAAA